MDAIRLVEAGQLKKDRHGFAPGDTVRVQVKVVEGEKERTQADHRVGHDQRRQLAAGEHVVADRERVVGQVLAHALVHALVAPGQQDQVLLAGQLARDALIERASPGVHQDHARARRAERFDRREQRLGLEHHSAAAAERVVVGDPVLAVRIVSEVGHPDVDETARARAADHRFRQRGLHDPRKQGDDIQTHEGDDRACLRDPAGLGADG